MPLALGSLDRVVPAPEGQSAESIGSAENVEAAEKVEVQTQPDEAERAEEARPEFERVTDVLGPLEQIVLAADHQIGSLQERVDAESSEVTSRIQSKVREAAREQRGRVLEMRTELTDAATQLATRFETMLDILDQAERQLASQAGETEPGMRVTLTEKRRVTFSHEQTESGPAPSAAPPVLEAPAEPEAPKKQKRIRRWFRRRKGSEA
jgi:hypothetical protein